MSPRPFAAKVQHFFDIDMVAQTCRTGAESLSIDRPSPGQRLREGFKMPVDAVVIAFEDFTDAEVSALPLLLSLS